MRFERHFRGGPYQFQPFDPMIDVEKKSGLQAPGAREQ
jgi:hypothetical protein